MGEQRFGMGGGPGGGRSGIRNGSFGIMGGDLGSGAGGLQVGAWGLWVGVRGGCRWGSGGAEGGGLGGAAGGRLGAHRAEGRAVGGHRGAVGGPPAPTWSLVRPSRSRMCVVTMRSVSSRRRGYGPSWGQGGQEWAGGGRGAALPAQRGAMGGGGGYLAGALPDGVDELLDNEVHALEARLLQLHHLLLHDGLERQIWGEQPRPGRQRGAAGERPPHIRTPNLPALLPTPPAPPPQPRA